MRAAAVVQAIRTARKANRPVMLWGPPGVGKTSLIALAAQLDEVDYRVLPLPLYDAVDMRGIPSVVKGVTVWNPPAELPRDGAGYLNCDELPQAPISVGNAATGLILGGRVGEYRLPAGWYVCATGNGEGDMAATNKMPTHVANRFIHIKLEVHHGDWIDWAERSNLDGRVIAFLKYRPEFLHQFQPRSTEKAFASPRTWEFASQIMQQMPGVDWSTTDQLELMVGIVGNAPAVEFVGFLRIFDKLVSLDSIIKDPTKAVVCSDVAVAYALVYALANMTSRANLKAIAQYIDRLAKEYGTLFFRRIDQQHPQLRKSAEFIAWASANQHLI